MQMAEKIIPPGRPQSNGTGTPLTVAGLAEQKLLAVEFLTGECGVEDLSGGGVKIPYYDGTGIVRVYRERGSKHGRKFYQPKGIALVVYGEWQLDRAARAGYLPIVEGESDTWTLWSHGLPALGIPGATAAKVLLAEHLVGVDRVYISHENDQGGATFVAGVTARLRELGYQGAVYDLRWPDGYKDPSALHVADPEKFLARFDRAVRSAELLPGDENEGGDWRVPTPLNDIPVVALFPLHTLPGPLGSYVSEAARTLNCPPDFVAVPLLAAAGGCIGNSRCLAVHDAHVQSACLFAAVIGRPGSGKSPALDMVIDPVEKAERRYFDEWKGDFAAWKDSEDEDKGDAPKLRRVLNDDTTTEAMASVLKDNARGLLMVRDEMAALVCGLNQYKAGKGHDRQVYLKLWSQGTIRVDRKNNPEGLPLRVYRPFVAIAGGLQPDIVPRLRGDAFRGVAPPNDGFLDRFLFSYPADPRAAKESWITLSPVARHAWEGVVDKLLNLEMVSAGKEDRPYLLKLTGCGEKAWEGFTEAHAAELNDPDFPEHLAGAWAKLRGYCGRLALIVHLLRAACGETNGEEVDGTSMDRAAELVTYFKSHARKIYAAMEADPKVATARRVLDCLRQNPSLNHFSRRDLHQCLRRSFPDPDGLDAPLALLVRFGYLREVLPDRAGRPGPNPPKYLVNPLWKSSQDPQDTRVLPGTEGSRGTCVTRGSCDREPGDDSGAEGEA
jgi:hypothetical protein